MSEREQLEQAISALEAQRAILGDAVLQAALAPMRAKLELLQAQTSAADQQRKQVTVLFADISGFTAMSETMDPEEVSETMNALWVRLDAAVTAHGGTIDKHIGDAIMGLFGAPTAHEDDPEQAIRAALTLQQQLRLFAETRGRELEMRIGISTGPVVLGAVGTTAEYTAMGDTVNLASRLEHAAPIGGILISHDTYRHVRGVFDVQALEPFHVKGKAEPVQAYIVQRARPRAFRVPTRGVEGIETRTIGRSAELHRLKAAAAAAVESRAVYVATVVGEAGVGKSRLLYEFNNWLDLLPADRQPRLFKGRATQEMIRLPYALLRDIFAAHCDIQDSDRAAVARAKLEQGITAVLGAPGVEHAHFIGYLLGLDFSNSPYLEGIRNDARQIRDRAFHYVTQFFATLTVERPAVILLEDIHWADDSSLDLFDHLGQNGDGLPLLILGLTRPSLFERRPSWGSQPEKHAFLELYPLSDQDCRALVAEILRKLPAIPPELQDMIVSRVDGSPYYVEELIKMLIEDGVIVIGDGDWRVELGRLAKVKVPSTLTGILQARLDGLPSPERALLQRASVVGRVFWNSAVEHLQQAGQGASLASSDATGITLGTLWRKELIFRRETSAFAETQEYIFKHAILRDVTYESVLRRLRRTYHAQIATWLSEHSAERVGEYAGLIGEHYERASELHEAAEWYAQAARQAHQTYAPTAAIDYYRRALAFWEKDASAAPPARRIEAYEGLGEMLNWQGSYPEAAEAYGAMHEVAQASGDQIAQARACFGLATAREYQGDHRAALESATCAEEMAQATGARAELALALGMKGRSLFRLGDAEKSLALGRRALALGEELADRHVIGRSLNLMGAVNNILGRYTEAERSWEEALAAFREAGDRRMVGVLLNNLGVIAEARGDDHGSFERYHEAVQIAHAIGHRNDETVYRSNLAGARIRLEEYSAAESDLRQVINMAGSAGADVLSDTYRLLARALLGQSKCVEAFAAARQALELGQQAGVQEYIGAAWRVLGLVAAQEHIAISNPPLPAARARGANRESGLDYAAVCFAESLRIFTEAGMEGERAQTLRAWATYELKRGDLAAGQGMWDEARAIFARLGAELEVARMDSA
jgi:predicted ATPase/class 3 adenylate cyclase